MKAPGSTIQQRTAGFRFSIGDALILILSGGFAYWLHRQAIEIWWVVPVAVFHFFLFCNVFLVWRTLEFIWAALLVLNAGIHFSTGTFSWMPVCAYQLPVTCIVVLFQLRSPWYHGIGARRINPKLDDFLSGKLQHSP